MHNQIDAVQYKDWAIKGLEFSEELWETNSARLNLMSSDASYFSIVLSISLIWTKHAKESELFIKGASLFFDGKENINDGFCKDYASRFGFDGLKTAMLGLKEYKNGVEKIMPNFKQCSAKDIKLFQDKGLALLNSLKNNGKAVGVGPWLFLGPFKIILGLEKRLWNDNTTDAIVMPSGVEVIRGVEKARKSGYTLFKDFKSEYLINEERKLLDGFTVDNIIQTYLFKVAESVNTRVIHINSAFYLYGGNY